MESVDNKEEKKDSQEKYRQEIHSKVIRAGKRTYFFDVKSTRNNEYYLTITESKKKFSDKGKFYYEKHKVFLYQEDFEKFRDSLEEVIQFIADNQPEIEPREKTETEEKKEVPVESGTSDDFSNLEFEDI
jgi:hypothetical protein